MENVTENITVEQIKDAVKEHDIRVWKLRGCSICLIPLTYSFNGDDPTYDSNCDCVSYSTEPEPRSWESIAEIFNMQTPAIRMYMWNEFLAAGSK